MDIPIRGINHITFSVSDLNASIAFYQQVFEATLLVRGERMAYLDVAGLWLALNVQTDIPREEIQRSYTHIAFTVDAGDIRPMEQRLHQLGISVRPSRPRETGEGASVYFNDPDGQLLEVHAGNLQTRIQAYRESEDCLVFSE